MLKPSARISLAFTANCLLASVGAGEGLRDKVEGLLVGSLIGDAAGGPVEFRPPDATAEWLPHCRDWPDERVVDADTLAELAAALRLAPYGPLREPSWKVSST